MPYDIQTADEVLTYLAAVEGLSTEGIERLITEYTGELGDNADHFHERYPLSHESLFFHFETVLVDGINLWGFNFVVDARNKAVGVLAVVYVEAKLLGTQGQ